MKRGDHCNYSIDLHAYLFRNPDTSQQTCNVGSCGPICCSWSNASGWEQTRPPSPLDSRPWSLLEFWSVEGQKQGAGGNRFSIFLHRHPVDLNYTLFLRFRLDFCLRHAGQLTAADDTTWWVQRFVDGNTYWSINESSGILRRPIACDFLAHSIRKDPSLNLLMLLRVPATAWNPFWTAKGDSVLSGRSSLDDSTTRNLGLLLIVFQKRSLSESVSKSWSLSRNLLFVCEDAMLCLLMIRYALSPPATESNKGMHTSGNSSKCAQGLETQYEHIAHI